MLRIHIKNLDSEKIEKIMNDHRIVEEIYGICLYGHCAFDSENKELICSIGYLSTCNNMDIYCAAKEEKKYEFTEEIIKFEGHILHRIKALKDFDDVKKGDLGGFIESEKNLSHEGNCWVYDDAWVFEDAKVYENAKISGSSMIYEDAVIRGNTEVKDRSHIYGTAILSIGKYYSKSINHTI